MDSAMTNADLISVVIPCHDEAGNLEALHGALTVATRGLPYRFEYIYVDDGSADDTVEIVRNLQRHHANVRLIELTRNFGKEIAVSAGLRAATGAAAITIDADLQHPPAIIPELITAWEGGAELVVGLRRASRSTAPALKRLGSALFYKFMNAISDVQVRARATDFRLLDRVVINEFNRFTERRRLARGLIDWLGFRRSYVAFTPARRHAGQAAYSYLKLFDLAITSFVSMSFFPLKVTGYLGVIITALSGPLGLFILIEKYVLGDPLGFGFTGPAILAVILLFVTGIILISLGLIALYVATIHTEALGRPLYVARPEKRPAVGEKAGE
jgi:dolichol-phosphate mannosyltransferase